ncbi:MAG TPA: YaiI/YqxD family protein [Mobilitalea sp.]|nr:YaiI/YqxD family protein [Mobilitalea sp.]
MKILVDADACPVKEIIEEVAMANQIPVLMFIDTSHILASEYSEIISVSKAPDAVDFALINRARKGDIVVTQDYGVAAMALGKGAYAIHHNGKVYTDSNIDQMLMERHIAKKSRRAGERVGGHAKKRTSVEDEHFMQAFHRLCEKAVKENSNESQQQ